MEFTWSWICGYMSALMTVLVMLLLYKLIDNVIRIPSVGQYSNRYIFVTGCDSGFGHELAKRLDLLGCHVFAGCLTEKGETELRKIGSERLQAVSLDLTKHDSVRKAFELVRSQLPPGQGLWGVLNNAGVLGPIGAPEWATIDDYRSTCDVNVFGLIDLTMTFMPLVKKSRGRIVNTSSINGRLSVPLNVPYNVSKYGVEAFTDALRRSLRPYGCKAVIIEPGPHNTPLMSTQNLRAMLERAWNQSSSDIRQEFGEDYFKYYTVSFMEKYEKVLRGGGVSDVVDAYQHALLSRHPRARYLVGHGAHYKALLAMLPEWFSDWMLVNRMMPLPAACRTSTSA